MNAKGSNPLTPASALHLLRECLSAAYVAHEGLGEAGTAEVVRNQFGDTALRCDIECEAAVLRVLKGCGVPCVIWSEEHGRMNLGVDPVFFSVLDGIDGSASYKADPGKNRYGTMLAFFDGTNPRYEDYLAAGILEHASARLVESSRGAGAWIREPHDTSSPLAIHTSAEQRFSESLQIYIDRWWDVNRMVFEEPLHEFGPICLDASCASYVDVARGAAHLSLECTRKNNLELAVAFGLIREAGGVMKTLEGDDLGPKRYLEFAQDLELHVPIVTAANEELYIALTEFLRRKANRETLKN